MLPKRGISLSTEIMDLKIYFQETHAPSKLDFLPLFFLSHFNFLDGTSKRKAPEWTVKKFWWDNKFGVSALFTAILWQLSRTKNKLHNNTTKRSAGVLAQRKSVSYLVIFHVFGMQWYNQPPILWYIHNNYLISILL